MGTTVGLPKQGLDKVETVSHEHNLPIKRSLIPIYTVSLVIAVLMAVASGAGLLYQSAVYPTNELIRTFVPNDVVNLFIGLPIILGSMFLAMRGKLVGLLLWPGALFFVLYNYIVYVFAMPFSAAFLLDLALVTLSVYAIAGLVASIDGRSVQQRIAGSVPERVAGGILAGLGLLFFLQPSGLWPTP